MLTAMFVAKLIAFFLMAVIGVPAITGYLYASVVRGSSRSGILWVCALTTPLLAVISGAFLMVAVVASHDGGGGLAFFFGGGLLWLGAIAILPGIMTGRVMARTLRPHEGEY